jgi:hypothetical protein
MIEDIIRKINRDKSIAIGCIEEIVESCDDWLNSIIQEPAFEFIKAIRDYTKKELAKIASPQEIYEYHRWANGKYEITKQ